MKRSRRVAATAVAATGVLGGAGFALAQAPGMQSTGAAQLAADTGTQPPAADTASLDAALAELEKEAGGLRKELATAQHQLDLAEQARARAAAAAKAAAAKAAKAAKAAARRPAPAPVRHTSTGASGAHGGERGEHEGGDDD